jgi:hypothetical protein
MTDLVDFVLARHGGTQRWEGVETISAKVHVYGVFWAFKGQPDLLGFETATADLKGQRISMRPFGDGRSLRFAAVEDLVTITDADGKVVDGLSEPRASMAGYQGDTLRSPTQMGYVISYATWIYLTEPLLFTLPGVQTREIEPWEEDGETWRRLEVTFPETIASHSKVQTYYFERRDADVVPEVRARRAGLHRRAGTHQGGPVRLLDRRFRRSGGCSATPPPRASNDPRGNGTPGWPGDARLDRRSPCSRHEGRSGSGGHPVPLLQPI